MLICTCILETQQWMELHLQSLIFTKRISRIWIFDLWSILCLWFHAFLSDPEIENRNGFIEYFYAAKFMIFSLCDVTDKKQVVTNIDVSKNVMKAAVETFRQKYFYRLCRGLMSDLIFMLETTVKWILLFWSQVKCPDSSDWKYQ